MPYPTKTRMRLLAHVDMTAVRRETYPSGTTADVDTREDLTVTSRIAELEAAGWVFLIAKRWETFEAVSNLKTTVQYWSLTDDGRDVLNGPDELRAAR